MYMDLLYVCMYLVCISNGEWEMTTYMLHVHVHVPISI